MLSPLALSDLRLAVAASVAGTRGDLRRLAARLDTLELSADLLDIGGAGAGDGGGVAEVGVDTSKELAGLSDNVLDHDVALGGFLAVSARAVELAEIDDGEAVDSDGSGTVVLDDLVLCAGGTTASDGSITITLEGESVYNLVSIL